MAAVDTVPTFGRAYTLSATGQSTPWFDPGLDAGIATISIVCDGSWSGTLSFEAATKNTTGLSTADPITATNINGGSGAVSTVAGASAIEHWRVDLAGGIFVRVTATVTTGTCTVTINVSRG